MSPNAKIYPFPGDGDGIPQIPAPFVPDLDQREAVAGRLPVLDEPDVPDATGDADAGLDDFGRRVEAAPRGEEDDEQDEP